MILSRDVAVIVEWAFFALTVAAVCVTIANGIRLVASRRRRARRATVAIIAVGVWLLAAAWVRIHTGFGVLVLQGADHWVSVAMAQEDDRRAAETLRQLIQSSNYGVNAAEKAALKLPADQQIRAFTLLAAVVPWDNWKETYRERALAARSRGERQTSLVADQPCNDAVDEALFRVETWEQLGSWLDAYPDCDDGYFAEHISETVSVWLSRSPRETVLLAEAIKVHPSLRSSVLRHIDVLSSEERTKEIRKNVMQHCPSGEEALCETIRERLDQLDAEIQRERRLKE